MNNITTQINIYNKKRGFSIFQTTDILTINAIIAEEQDKRFTVGAVIELIESEGDNKKWKIVQIEVSVYNSEILLPVEVIQDAYQGQLNPYNTQIIVYVEEFSE